MAWFYLGRQAAAYFIKGCGMGEGAQRLFASKVYPLLFIAAVFLGSEARLALVWLLSDIWNGLMAFPNLTALLFLSKEVTVPEGYGKSGIHTSFIIHSKTFYTINIISSCLAYIL